MTSTKKEYLDVILGIDIGGSALKGAPVNLKTGKFAADRFRVATDGKVSVNDIMNGIKAIIEHFNWNGPIGIGFPGVVKKGIVLTAANLHKNWPGTKLQKKVEALTGKPCTVLNDADAAGIAEMEFGAGKKYSKKGSGSVLMITLGTGIGTALFVDGMLVPNLELGRMELNGDIAEHRAAASARDRESLGWKRWGKRVNKYLQAVEYLLSADVIIVGGGVSSKFEKFAPNLKTKALVLPAALGNHAGIVGAAIAATKKHLFH